MGYKRKRPAFVEIQKCKKKKKLKKQRRIKEFRTHIYLFNRTQHGTYHIHIYTNQKHSRNNKQNSKQNNNKNDNNKMCNYKDSITIGIQLKKITKKKFGWII